MCPFLIYQKVLPPLCVPEKCPGGRRPSAFLNYRQTPRRQPAGDGISRVFVRAPKSDSSRYNTKPTTIAATGGTGT